MRRKEIEKNPDLVWRALKNGAEQAREKAGQTMIDVRKAMDLDW
jgi:hypothetical protein